LTLTPQAEQFFAISLPLGLPSIFFPNEPSILVVRVAIITVALAVFALAFSASLLYLLQERRLTEDPKTLEELSRV